jgi:hypothetical protein
LHRGAAEARPPHKRSRHFARGEVAICQIGIVKRAVCQMSLNEAAGNCQWEGSDVTLRNNGNISAPPAAPAVHSVKSDPSSTHLSNLEFAVRYRALAYKVMTVLLLSAICAVA